ncbi:MAG: two-component regulator propeller domain-containing protein [Bacteroides sp.]
MKTSFLKLFIALLMGFGGKLGAQELSSMFTHYSIDDGLSQNTVMSMAQDSKGVMWLATWNGLNRFDGTRFYTYRVQWGNPSGMTNSRIDFIRLDAADRIWGLTYSRHGCFFNPLTEEFARVPAEGEAGSDAAIVGLQVLRDAVWLLAEGGGAARAVVKQATGTPESTWFPAELLGRVSGVVADAQGNEWIYGEKGLFRFSAASPMQQPEQIPLPPSAGSGQSGAGANGQHFLTALLDGDYLYLGNACGQVWRYDGRDLKPLQLAGADSPVICLGPLSDGRLLAVTARHGLFLCPTVENGQQAAAFPQAQAIPLPQAQAAAEVYDAYVDAADEVWLDQHIPGQLLHYSTARGTWRTEQMEVEPTSTDRSRPAFHAHEDIRGTLWIHPHGGGFARYDRAKERLVPFHNSMSAAADGEWRFSNKIHSSFSDAQGNLWLCTHSKGLEKVTFRPRHFSLLVPEPRPYESLSNEVRALFEDSRGQVWAGTKDDRLRLYDRTRRFLGYLTADGRISRQGEPMRGNVYALAEDSSHNLWIATKGDGLVKAEPQGEGRYRLTHFRHDEADPYSLSNDNVYSVYEDVKGRIWVATYDGGVNYLITTPEGRPRFIHAYNELKQYPIERCSKARFVTGDRQGRIWIGTTLGALVAPVAFDEPQSLRFTPIYNKVKDEHSLSNNDVHWILPTRTDTVYLATFGGGLNRLLTLTPEGEATLRSYGTAQGLASDVVLSIREDRSGHLWMSTESGVSRFDPRTESFINYSGQEMAPHARFSEAASEFTSWGRMLFGTSSGICSFNPDSTLRSSYVPHIVLSRLTVAGRDVQPSPRSFLPVAADGLKELVLTHRDNLFSLHYAALDFNDPDRIQYAYMLEGLDKGWNYVAGSRTAIYTNVPKGHYRFKVRSTNADGVWVDNERVLPIEILPSFWETSLAYFLYVLFILLFIVTAVYILFTIYRLKHEVVVEQQVSDMKLRFFTDISHELRTPLTLIAGPVEHVLQHSQLPDDARHQLEVVGRNTNRMLRLINQILDFRKIQNKKMKLQVQRIEVVEFAHRLMENYQAVAEERGIDFRFETSAPQIYLYADADKLEKIIFNLLSNAFKYTPDGKQIRLFVGAKEERVLIGVADQGIGFDESKKRSIFLRFENLVDRKLFQQSTGIGLSLVKELVEMHGAEIEVESRPGEGSCFTVNFQAGKEHFAPGTEFLQDDASAALLTMHPDEAGVEQANEEQPTLLVVEDNSELRLFLHTLFSGSYRMVEAANGLEGLEKALQVQPDLIISDVMMPEMDGIEMLRRLRADVATSHLPVVLLTAKTSIESQIEGLEYGADAYVTKPFSATFLKARVKNLLSGRKLLQAALLTRLMPASNQQSPMGGEQCVGVSESVAEGTASGASGIPSAAEAPVEAPLSPHDQKFLDKLVALMEKNMDNGELLVDDLVQEMAVSRSVFFKKLKTLTGLAPVEFIKEVRINRAIELIKTGEYSMTQVAYMVGINDPRYFSKCFKAKMGMTPTEFRDRLKQQG